MYQADEQGLQEAIAKWNPKEDRAATDDAYKTLFVSKISYDTTEKKVCACQVCVTFMYMIPIVFATVNEQIGYQRHLDSTSTRVP